MKKVLALMVLMAGISFGQNKIPITKIDDATQIWKRDSIVGIDRVTFTRDTAITTFQYFKLIKTKKVKVPIQKYLESQKKNK
jgi:hypothetical protein